MSEFLVSAMNAVHGENFMTYLLWLIHIYTLADIIIAFYIIKFSAITIGKNTLLIKISYWLLGLSVLLVPLFQIIPPKPDYYTFLTAGIAGIHYSIIIANIFNIRHKVSAIFNGLG